MAVRATVTWNALEVRGAEYAEMLRVTVGDTRRDDSREGTDDPARAAAASADIWHAW
jgi:hypothetical protein